MYILSGIDLHPIGNASTSYRELMCDADVRFKSASGQGNKRETCQFCSLGRVSFSFRFRKKRRKVTDATEAMMGRIMY